MSEKRFDKIDDKLEKIDDKLHSQGETLLLNTQSLIEHIKRTNALEERLEPVEKHVTLVNAGAKIIGIFAGILVALKAAIEIFKFFRH